MWNQSLRYPIDYTVEALRQSGLYPDPPVIFGPTTDPEIALNGKKVIQFCSANYLGLANHPKIKDAIIDGLNKYGVGTSGSRLTCGTQDVHLALEDRLAKFHNVESAALFFLVTTANMGSIDGILNLPLNLLFHLEGAQGIPPSCSTEIFLDQYSHPSISDACILAKKSVVTIYRHNDMDDLETKLKKSSAGKKLIATDGVFSSEGDIAPLINLVELSEKYEAAIFVDDAHATGVLGRNGRGTCELLNVENKINISVGSLSKALAGGLGGYVVGDKNLIDYIRITGKHYIFGGSIPPALAMGIMKAIDLASSEGWRREKVLSNARYLLEALRTDGFNTFNSQSAIIPILVGCEEKAIAISRELLQNGIFAGCFRYPAVPRGKARIRITLMATHEREHLDKFLYEFRSAWRKYCAE